MNFQFPTLNTGKVPNFSAHKNPTGRQTSREIKWLRKYGTLDLLSRFLRDTCARKTRGKENQSCGKVLTGEIYLTIDNILFSFENKKGVYEHSFNQGAIFFFRKKGSKTSFGEKTGLNYIFFRKNFPLKARIIFILDDILSQRQEGAKFTRARIRL